MGRKQNEIRNRDLVAKRLADPKTWSWARLGKVYGISRYTARDLFERHIEGYIKTG